jgi:amino acid transporter
MGGQIQLSDKTTRKGKTMGRIIKALVVLVIFAFIGLTGFAYLGDLTPSQGEVKKPVVLNAD